MEIPQASELPVVKEPINNGDCFDEDTGIYYGRLTDDADNNIVAPPVNISIFVNGFTYVYSLTSRYQGVDNGDQSKKD